MYSRRIIDNRIREFMDAKPEDERWEPVYHSVGQIQDFCDYIDRITKVTSNEKRSFYEITVPLTVNKQRTITRWIQNEQILCSVDSSYWETRYGYLCDEKGQIIKFHNRTGQEIFDQVVADLEDLEVAIELLILKGRQQGVSLKTALKFLHRMLFRPHSQSVMASAQQEKSELIARVLAIAYEKCPWWLKPRKTEDRVGKRMGWENGSLLSIQSGMQATGIAQGWTPTNIHICLSPDSSIHVANGRVKRICEVSAGDEVITSTGRMVDVKAVARSPRENEVACELSLWGNYEPLVVTRDHKILTPTGFMEAENIEKGGWVAMPVRPIENKRMESWMTECKKGRPSKGIPPAKKRFVLDGAWGWLCGLYLSEGCAHRNAKLKGNQWDNISFCISSEEIEDFLPKLRMALSEKKKISVRRSRRGKGAVLVVNSSSLARWMVETFGHLAENKFIPDWMFAAGHQFVKGLLQGYIEGDGHIPDSKNQVTCTSVSQALIIQVRDLLASNGFGWASLYNRPAGFYYGRNCSSIWTLHINGESAEILREKMGWSAVSAKAPKYDHDPRATRVAKHWKYSPDGKFIWIQVYENRPVECASFYDLEVDAIEHDFCTTQCCVKNSELADIPNPQKTLEEGLLRATHSSKYLFQVWEGTGGGNTGYLADKWRAAKEDWPRGRSRLRPMFLSWPLAPDLYPEKDWLKKYPIPEAWQPHQETKKHVRKCELYIQNTDYLARVCGSNWEMPRFQQWFWEFNYDEAVKSHSQRTWMQQMPADDMEALVGKHDRIFDVDVIELHEKSRERKFQAYALISNQIDSGFEPPDDQIDYDQPRIIVEWESHRGQRYEWIMVPLLPFDETNERNALDKILIFEHPIKGCDYSVGVDTADGLGNEDEDRSCFSVTRNETDDRQDVQVAEFVSNRVNPAQMVGFAACIGAYFGRQAKDPRGVKFCIEQRDRPGDDCQFQLKLMGFLWHHSNDRIDGKKVREGSSSQHGFMTNAWSRPLLIGRFVEAVNGMWYKINSPYLLAECDEWERKILASGKSRVDHKSGKHDDRIFSAAMSYFTRHAFDVLADRSAKRYNTVSTQPILNESMCSDGFLVSVGD